jgi:hypothetical protein
MLCERAAYKRYFDPSSDPFYTMFDVGEYTLSPWKVAWSRIAWHLEAAVVSKVDGKPILPQETFSFIDVNNEIEAHFVCGVMNSTPYRLAVSSFSQPGSKSFGTPSILEKAKIPRFDPQSDLHKRIATEAQRLTTGVVDAGEQVFSILDTLCAGLWGVNNKELEAVTSVYKDMYVTEKRKSGKEEVLAPEAE